MRILPVGVVCLLLTSGCLSLSGEARRRASYEFECPLADVVVRQVPDSQAQYDLAFDVDACGNHARYVCTMHIELLCRREPLVKSMGGVM